MRRIPEPDKRPDITPPKIIVDDAPAERYLRVMSEIEIDGRLLQRWLRTDAAEHARLIGCALDDGDCDEPLPIVEVDDRKIGSGVPGPITTKLHDEFRRRV